MNKLWTIRILTLCAALTATVSVRAADAPEIMLWPKGAPGSEGQTAPEKLEPPTARRAYSQLTSIHKPSITVYLPPAGKETGAAIVVCPGGSHQFLAWDIEGDNVGKYLADHGIAGFILKYRLARDLAQGKDNPYKVEVHALADAQRAMRTVRSRAQEWKLNPEHIGIMGFSAGGQLAALEASRYETGVLTNADDEIDKISCRPDFQALIYPALPSDLHPSKAATPPAFMLVGEDDGLSVPLANLFVEMQKAKVTAELHVYSHTQHGFGIRPGSTKPEANWPDRLVDWLGQNKFLKN